MPTARLSDLATKLRERSVEVDEYTSRLAIRATQEMLTHLVYNTPVDTSEALSNWQVTLDEKAPVRRLKPFFVGSAGSSREASAKEAIRQANIVLSGKKPGQVIYLSNVRPDYNYIIRLNNGYSDQSPGGFIETALIAGRQSIRDRKT